MHSLTLLPWLWSQGSNERFTSERGGGVADL